MRSTPLLLITVLALACIATKDASSTEGQIPEATPMTPAVGAYAPPPRERPLPQGQMVVNMSCFSGVERDLPKTAPMGGSAKGRGGAVPAAPVASAPAPTPMAAPKSSANGAFDALGSATADEGDARRSASEAQGAAAPPPPARAEPAAERREEAKSAEAPMDRVSPGMPWVPPPPPMERRASVDWGGTVFLSNDDSASLASAQRLLYALDRNASFSVGQIRPHELLNYFTFDTVAPAPGQTFGVSVSGERVDNDTLSLALAVKGATPPREDLDLTLVIDRSGSMSAEGRMDYTRRALHKLGEQLHRGDRVNLVLFDHQVCTPLQNFVVGRDDPSALRQVIDAMQPRGSTDLNLGLKSAYSLATANAGAGRTGRVMVFTDAILNTGDVNPETVSEIGRALDAHNIRLTGVGVGSEFRDDVLNKLTEKGKGAYVFLGSERVVDRLFGAGFDGLVHTIAADVHFALDLPPSLGMEKFYGEESSTRITDVQAVNFQAGNAQLFLEDLAIHAGQLVPSDPILLTATWKDPYTGAPREERFSTTVGQALSTDPHNSRKGRALIAWSDVLMARAMGQDACGQAFQGYRAAMGGLEGDAEIAYASELLGKWCGRPEPIAAWTAPAFTKIRFDSDTPVSEVAMDCNGSRRSVQVSGSDTVATFQAPTGSCQVTLYGAVPMTQRVEVPQTGADIRCVVRGGRMSCG